METSSDSPSPLGEAIFRSCEIEPSGDQYQSIGDDDIGEALDLQLDNATILGSSEADISSSFLPKGTGATANPDAHEAVEINSSRIPEVANTIDEEDSTSGKPLSDVECPLEDAFETDSSYESDISDAESEIDIDDTDATSQPNLYMAKSFLERNWGRLYDCQEEEEEEEGENASEDTQPGLSLKDMANY
ncbi:hypothetical protein Focb16_v015444 [Fusarium oxysporum f. sp. cubense]|uniref:Uncharacterized protein n=1 Tax=Fusarium oxysporum f. sp. cubense TaxID=61366 RepID=A0A559KX49_FUSOC|nr:hypothetical protein Focb16_v015444 [Fusarium oxysporum f. sp. cubense]